MALNKSLKFVIKRSMHHIAAKFGTHTRSSNEPQLLILMYHRVLPGNDERAKLEEPGMLVSPATFKINIEELSTYFEFIQLSDWLERKKSGLPLPKKSCAITFDDGWVDNYEYAFPILQEKNIPATIFLVSDMIGSKQMFWPERLSRTIFEIAKNNPDYWSNPNVSWIKQGESGYQFNNIPPTQEELSRLISAAKQLTDQKIHALLDTIQIDLRLDDNQHTPSLMNWQQVSEMIDSGLIEVGSHTCHHIRLNKHLSKEVLEKEIISSKEKIEKRTGNKVKTFCFPNGDYSEKALTMVKNHYLGAVTTKNGWNNNRTDYHLLQRIGIHEDIAKDKTAFLARISGCF